MLSFEVTNGVPYPSFKVREKIRWTQIKLIPRNSTMSSLL